MSVLERAKAKDAAQRVGPTEKALKDGKEDEDIIKLRQLREEFKSQKIEALIETGKLKLAEKWK